MVKYQNPSQNHLFATLGGPHSPREPLDEMTGRRDMKADGIAPKLLRATITIDVEAADYLEAAEHQKRLAAHMSQIRADFPDASAVLIERRRPAAEPAVLRKLYERSGRLNNYD
jgi:hypothetical protein